MKLVLRVLCVLSFLAGAAIPAGAKSLYWDRLAVTARLESDGRLRVQERHVIVFDGDWNGGYRTFNVSFGQSLDLERVSRIAADGREIALVKGDTDSVDHYDWGEGWQLRWRSRLPSDPPFAHEAISYVLEYSLSGILIALDDGQFLLNHDFAFSDREGTIERFELSFDLDPAWQAPADLSEQVRANEGRKLEPGEGAVIQASLRYLRPGAPAAVWMPVSLGKGIVVVGALGLGLAVLLLRWLRREARLGRFARLTAVSTIDEAWLREHLLSFRPEEVGVAWDDRVGPAEVAAVLARLVVEGKLSTRVETTRFLFLPQRALHMQLQVSREELPEAPKYEQQLITALFGSSSEASTDSIRKRYKSTGFNPASHIASELRRSTERHSQLRGTAPPPSHRFFLTLLAVGVLLAVVAVVLAPVTILALLLFFLTLVPLLVARGLAALWRSRIDWLPARLGLILVLALIPAAVATWFAVAPPSSGGLPLCPSFWMLVALAVLALAGLELVLAAAAIRDGVAKIVCRKHLAAARRYFRSELGSAHPRLRDEWFPYVVAFGLGSDADRWFRRFGGAAEKSRAGSGWSGSSSGSTSPSSSPTWRGGGGSFGGGGAGGTWVSAVGGVAAGVSAPSKSSSGGGSSSRSSGGSSGGGGGGGW